MALTLKTLQNLEGLLTSDRISYKGTEVLELTNILAELRKEQAEIVQALRVVPAVTPPCPDFSKEDQGS